MENSDVQVNAGGGIGFIGALQIAFIVLKLCSVINWPWWVVLAPLWGSAVVTAGVIFLVIAIAIVILIAYGRDR